MSQTSLILWKVYSLIEKDGNEQAVIEHCDLAMRR